MASFLARALKLGGSAPDAFTDDETSIHEPNINLVAKAGVATGCGGGEYCPTANVTRGHGPPSSTGPSGRRGRGEGRWRFRASAKWVGLDVPIGRGGRQTRR